MILLGLVPLAHANLPDETWIGGIYDDADYDDVVVTVGSAMGTVEEIRPAMAPVVLLLVAVLAGTDAWLLPSPPRLPSAGRAPPA